MTPHLSAEHTPSGEKLSLLAIFAHPDDESFGLAGTLAKYANEGVQVSLVNAYRPQQNELSQRGQEITELQFRARDQLCSCRASGVRRVCFLNLPPGALSATDPLLIEDQLVRLIREIQPQVIVTFGPDGLGDEEDKIISRAATAAFRSAGDAARFAHHFQDGLGTYAPQKLYYCVLPQSLAARWGIEGLPTIPDEQITTTLDVSSYGTSTSKTMFCNRNKSLDNVRGLIAEKQIEWDTEYYALAQTHLQRKPRREKDLFAGLR